MISEVEHLKPIAPVAILGMGKSGAAANRVLKHLGFTSEQVCFWDEKAPKAQYSNPQTMLKEFSPRSMILSPGVPRNQEWLDSFVASGGVLLSELELGLAQLSPNELVLGVTGSLGKSTTAAWLHWAILSEDPQAFLGGNFGIPLCDYVSDRIEGKAQAKYLVLELSSFQLELARNLRSVGSIVCNFYPNHLDRYESFAHYCLTKWNLVKRTFGPVICNNWSQLLREFSVQHQTSSVLWSSEEDVLGFDKSLLKGAHNAENYRLVARLLKELRIKEKCGDRLLSFPGLSHRLENIGLRNGVQFINDSKSTTVESVNRAIEACLAFGHLMGTHWVLLGGRDKDLPWAELSSRKNQSNLKFLFFGEAADKIKRLSGLNGTRYQTLRELLVFLPQIVKIGDLVLLSPGGSSLDEFKNFEDRGEVFKKAICELFPKMGGY